MHTTGISPKSFSFDEDSLTVNLSVAGLLACLGWETVQGDERFALAA